MATIFGTSDNDFRSGTDGSDAITAFEGDDTVRGLAGNDLVFGNQGSDILNGNQGSDTIYGGQGNDTIFGGQGDDLVFGDRGNDVLFGGRGVDTLQGGEGRDVFVIDRQEGENIITDFEPGFDLIGLADGLTLSDLIISQGIGGSPGDALIQEATTGRILARLQGISSAVLSENSFVGISASTTPTSTPTPTPIPIPIPTDSGLAPIPSVVQIAATDPLAEEFTPVQNSSPPRGQFTVSRDNIFGNLQVSYLVSGTATNGVDYTAIPSTVTIPNGQRSASIIITPIADNITEGDETVILTLDPDPNGIYTIGRTNDAATDNAATVTIRDRIIQGQTVSIEATDPIASELNSKTATFTVRRTGSLTNELVVNYNVSQVPGINPATNGGDFNFLSGNVTIPAGQSFATITVFPLVDPPVEGVESFRLTLLPPTGYSVINGIADGYVTDSAINNSFFPGTPGNDRIVGTATGPGVPGNDLIFGGDGNDVLNGNTGDDTIDGGNGNDDIRGNFATNSGLGVGISDDDSLIGGPGDDTINGDVGNDTLVGGPGRDILFGGDFGSATENVDSGLISNRFVFNRSDEGPDLIGDFVVDGFIDRDDDGVFSAGDNAWSDVIVLSRAGFNNSLSISNSIAPAEFQNAVNVPGIAIEPTARILYLQGGVGVNGVLYYVPDGITVAGAIPTNHVLIAELTSPTGIGSPNLNEAQIQVIP